MNEKELLPHLFRTEYQKIISVLVRHYGFEQLSVAEDIASDTFLLASETWGIKGLPENPVAWLYTVAKNRAKDYLRRDNLFSGKIAQQIKNSTPTSQELEIDLSEQN